MTNSAIIVVLLLCIALVSTACMKRYSGSADYQTRLSAFPTPFSEKEVEVFFPGERPSDTAYVKIGVLEQRMEGQVPYTTLLNKLKAKAQEQGLDAILVLDKNQSTRLRSTETLGEVLASIVFNSDIDEDYESITTHELVAVGIKYKRNFSYLSSYVKEKKVYLVEQDREVLLVTVSVDHKGMPATVTPASEADAITYNNYVRAYDVDYLLKEESPRWRYSARAGLVKARKLMSGTGNGASLKVKVQYNEKNLPQKLKLEYPDSPALNADILLSYQGNQVVEKLVYLNGSPYLKEVNSFSPDGKLHITLHYLLNNGQEKFFLKTVYNYYGALSLK